jgi:hypothetical protein
MLEPLQTVWCQGSTKAIKSNVVLIKTVVEKGHVTLGWSTLTQKE